MEGISEWTCLENLAIEHIRLKENVGL